MINSIENVWKRSLTVENLCIECGEINSVGAENRQKLIFNEFSRSR
jgi:hypothetical protein